MTSADQRDKENQGMVEAFLFSGEHSAEKWLRKHKQERFQRDKESSCGSNDLPRPTANEKPVQQAEAMAGLLKELAERVDLLREELWRLRAMLAQQGGEQ